jgi:hypothetical protein
VGATTAPVVEGPSAAAVPQASSAVHPVTTVVVTDDPAVTTKGASAESAWPALLAARLAASGAPMTLSVAAVDGAGFAADRSAASSFTELVVSHVVHSTQLVIFFDTALGAANAPAIGEGAAAAFKTVEEAAPDAVIVVVGPYRFSADAPEPGDAAQRAVRDAARGAEVAVTYVDPAAGGWPTGPGQSQIAQLLHDEIGPLVKALAESGAFD